MKLVNTIALCGFGILAVSGCEEPFSPKGPFQEKVAIYSVLSRQTDSQFVRLYLTYDPPGFDPLVQTADRQVTGALVTMSSGSQTVTFRDTTIDRPDKSRFTSPIQAYIGYPLLPSSGATYTLTAQTANYGSFTATASIPGPATLDISNPFVLTDPSTHTNTDIIISIVVTPNTKGLLTRFFLEYEVATGSGTYLERAEVPSSIRTGGLKSYPSLTRAVSRVNRETAVFTSEAFGTSLTEIRRKYPGVVFRKAIFIATQVEINLYNYYNIVNGFQDPYSIRQDLPDYSNINGGLGLFGAFGMDSTSIALNYQ